ncbi:alpha/beta fold hydrolase [Halobacillus litoralis]|uniref:alpha/beta hydrolase n=1 Tax=Halobacillus litoralis TaxID=45668 RepID=UPI001CD74FE0|nr:alpha/beta fold hydrolase [Halobacillus litoralis]MCA0972195.1 alpha/beta fold hydrolase [Halobacillus litoralis]
MEQTYPVIKNADSFFIDGGKSGILICHGFLGTPQSVWDFAHGLSAHGYTVSCPRLPGHGTHYKDLELYTYSDWYQTIERAFLNLKKRCDRVYVVGQSMGGTLTLDLARQHAGIEGIILLNPAIRIPGFESYRDKPAVGYVQEGRPDIKRMDVEEITYDYAPVSAYHQLLDYMDLVRGRLHEVDCPVSCFQSLEDHVVPPENSDYILEHVRSKVKEKHVLADSYHIASMDFERDQIVEQAVSFMKTGAETLTST